MAPCCCCCDQQILNNTLKFINDTTKSVLYDNFPHLTCPVLVNQKNPMSSTNKNRSPGLDLIDSKKLTIHMQEIYNTTFNRFIIKLLIIIDQQNEWNWQKHMTNDMNEWRKIICSIWMINGTDFVRGRLVIDI